MASLILVYALYGISSTHGDPLWGSIVSKYSMNDRKKYVLVNKIYFFIRTCFAFISWWVFRQCVISGIGSFTMLALILITIMIIIYLISDFINQRIFGTSI